MTHILSVTSSKNHDFNSKNFPWQPTYWQEPLTWQLSGIWLEPGNLGLNQEKWGFNQTQRWDHMVVIFGWWITQTIDISWYIHHKWHMKLLISNSVAKLWGAWPLLLPRFLSNTRKLKKQSSSSDDRLVCKLEWTTLILPGEWEAGDVDYSGIQEFKYFEYFQYFQVYFQYFQFDNFRAPSLSRTLRRDVAHGETALSPGCAAKVLLRSTPMTWEFSSQGQTKK